MLTISSHAGNFKVAPIHIYFDANEKSSLVRISNLGEEVTIQTHVLKWRQNENGNDEYEETDEIVIFPKMATVEKGKERVIRLGYLEKKALVVEGTYRLMIEELPVRTPDGTMLKFALRMRLPIFVSPTEKIIDRSIEKVEIQDGNLLVSVRNDGNAHITVSKIRAVGLDDSGRESFSKEKPGLHILAGSSKTYAMDWNQEDCMTTRSVKIKVELDREVIESTLDIDQEICTVN
jgi:fimbrial chaperone protein